MYRIARASAAPFHLVDLPGYGYARRIAQGLRAESKGQPEPEFDDVARAAFARSPAALLLVDARHPGLERDRAAWEWVSGAAAAAAVVATKVDKLARGERIRAMRQLESVFEATVVPVSASTGEGMEILWNLIESLVNRSSRNSRRLPNPTEAGRHLRKK